MSIIAPARGARLPRRRACALPALLLLILTALLTTGDVAADVFRGGVITLSEGEAPATYVLTARLPAPVAVRDGLVLPGDCRLLDVHQAPAGTDLILTWRLGCASPLGAGDALIAPWRVDAAAFTLRLAGAEGQAVLRPDRQGRLTLPLGLLAQPAAPRPVLATAGHFVWQGMLHIWFGWDHLALVLCVVLTVRGAGLLWLITTFTVGHSLSLALAFFEVVRIPVPPVEAVIALSIVWLARDALRAPERRSGIRPHDFVVVSVFGLIHGLGFASALGELGVAPGERAVALATFNAGVEIGQVAIVAALVGVLGAMAQLQSAQRLLRTGALHGAGGVGAFWLLERVAGF